MVLRGLPPLIPTMPILSRFGGDVWASSHRGKKKEGSSPLHCAHQIAGVESRSGTGQLETSKFNMPASH